MESPLRILVINPLWPHPSHSVRAANIVFFELLSEFANQPSVEVAFLKLNLPGDSEPSGEEYQGIEQLKQKGIKILPPVNLPSPPTKRPFWRRLLQVDRVDFYPYVAHFKQVESVVLAEQPDLLFIPWSELATALCADIKVPKFAYYGNPDPKAGTAWIQFQLNHKQVNLFRYWAVRYQLRQLERLHLREMAKYEFLGNVAANDALYYRDRGHPNAFYIQNLWIDRFGQDWQSKRQQLEQTQPAIIIGNIGKLGGTANSYGLEILGRDIVPELRRSMAGIPYEVHILGAAAPNPGLVPLLQQPEIRMRGFVDDIDQTLLESQVFLCLNNGSPYKVGHTRYLHAWSVGCCVIAHADCALSMPEMVHQENCLLGRTPAEIADLVAEAIANPELRWQLGRAGYKTFKESFTATQVVPKILNRINLKR